MNKQRRHSILDLNASFKMLFMFFVGFGLVFSGYSGDSSEIIQESKERITNHLSSESHDENPTSEQEEEYYINTVFVMTNYHVSGEQLWHVIPSYNSVYSYKDGPPPRSEREHKNPSIVLLKMPRV